VRREITGPEHAEMHEQEALLHERAAERHEEAVRLQRKHAAEEHAP
jgi:hypothetical protein